MQYTREERATQVIDVLATTDYMTAAEVAGRVGLRKSPYLRDIMQELIEDGHIAVERRQLPNGLPVDIFYLLGE